MNLNFNAFDYDPIQGGSICFPLADYKLEITGAEPKVVKDNPAAGYLELALTVIEGDMRGLIQKHRLNLFNPNETAKRIAHQELSAIAFAIERPYLQTTEQLLGGRFIATIGPQLENEKYSEVKQIKLKDGTLPTKPAQGPQVIQSQQPPPAAQLPVPASAAPLWGASAAPAPATPSAAPPWASGPPALPAAASAPPWASTAPSQPQGATAAPPWAK